VKLLPVEIPTLPKGLRAAPLAVTDPHFSADAGTGLIEIFDSIGESGTTPARISAALRSIGPKPITVAINSPGGAIHDGLTIFNLLRGHGASVTTRVLGLAASAAAVVAMAGDQVEMAKASQMMVHRSQGLAAGNAELMRQVAVALDKVDGVMADIFTARTGLPRNQIVAMLQDETFFDASEAVDLGFADRLIAQDAVAPPRLSASTTPNSRHDLEDQLHRLGFSRSTANRMTAVAWAARGIDEPDLDLEVIAAAATAHFQAMSKPYT